MLTYCLDFLTRSTCPLQLCLTLLLLTVPRVAAETTSNDVIDTHRDFQNSASSSQSVVESLDEEMLKLLSEYNTEMARLETLEVYNENLRAMLANQASEKRRIESALREIEVTRRQIVPLMTEMVDVLGTFIELDQPMLVNERNARLAALKDNMGRSDVELAEKFRRIMEGYQIEAEYGQSIEAYEGQVETVDGERTVDFLRVGRAALYYVGLDRNRAAIWDQRAKMWVPVEGYLDELDYALRVARKQAPPDLMPLPLWAPDR